MPENKPVIRRPRLTLRLKLTFGLILIIGVVFAAQNVFQVITHRNNLLYEAGVNRETVGRVVVAALTGQLANEDLKSSRIRNFLHNFLTVSITQNKRNRDLAFGLVVDNNNTLIAGRAKPQLTTFPGDKHLDSEKEVLEEIASREGKLGRSMRTQRFTLRVPGRGEVGKLLVGTSLARLEQSVQRSLLINGSVFVGALLLLIGYASLTLGHWVVNPIRRLMGAMRDVHEGNLQADVVVKANDEIGVLADTYNFMLQGLREREQLKDAFSRYVSTQVYDRLQSGSLTLTGENRNATVLFSDIRSFTALSEQLSPPQVVTMLNEYFNEMVEIVFKYDGFLNKFIGDALMAIYNVPLDQTQPEMRAVCTAIEMIQALKRLNAERAKRGLFALKIGIGINTGPVVAGNIGHLKRLEYTVIGDAVNLAQRIEGQTKVTGMPILISQATYEAVADQIKAQTLPPVKVKGKQEPVPLYGVAGLKATVMPEELSIKTKAAG